MPIALSAISLLALLFIMAEDFRYKEIRLVWFIVLILSLLVARVFFEYSSSWLINSGINLITTSLLIAASLLLLVLFRQSKINSMGSFGGVGDVLMIVAFCLSFEPFACFGLLFISSIVALIIHLFISHRDKFSTRQVPLAGYMAIAMIVVIGLQVTNVIQLQLNDTWIKFLYSA